VLVSTVTDHLKARGVPFETIPHEVAYTSIEEARAVGIAADEIAKTIVLRTAARYALAVVPGTSRLDLQAVREATDDRRVRFATEQELERDFPGYELGALPPLGSLLGLPAYVDPAVLEHDTVVFAAGTQTESVKAKTGDLFKEEKVTVASLTHHAGKD
jgi:Ala-tRNA(Pro) deacylase